MKKTVAFVPVRLDSSRVYQKHLRHIGPKTLLAWVVERLSQVKGLDEIVICIPKSSEHTFLGEFCTQYGIQLFVFDGPDDHVVERFVMAAGAFEATVCILASGDCPLLDPEAIERGIECLKNTPESGYVLFEGEPIHEGILIAKKELWERAHELSNTLELQRHQFPILYTHPEKFSPPAIYREPEIYYALHHRISVDTAADFAFHHALYRKLEERGKEYHLLNVLELLKEEPALLKINGSVYQLKASDPLQKIAIYLSSRKKLDLAFRYAKAATEHLGVGVFFIVTSQDVAQNIQNEGFMANLVEDVRSLEVSAIFSDQPPQKTQEQLKALQLQASILSLEQIEDRMLLKELKEVLARIPQQRR